MLEKLKLREKSGKSAAEPMEAPKRQPSSSAQDNDRASSGSDKTWGRLSK